MRLVIDEAALQAGASCTARVEMAGLGDAGVQWHIPAGWMIDGEGTLSVPLDAPAGAYEISATVRAEGGEVVLAAEVEVVPEAIKV